MESNYIAMSEQVLKSRCCQLFINKLIGIKRFRIPIHLALGHEAIAEAVASVMQDSDKLICTHRNIHYQFAQGTSLHEILDEFLLKESGVARGICGSMNLTNPDRSIIYTSSILGNNLCVATGVALSQKVRLEKSTTIVVTGDGAMEEGSFYESIENARSLDLPLIIIVENNNWSLASQISERRKPIDLYQLASSLGVDYTLLSGNDLLGYHQHLSRVRSMVINQQAPHIIEVELTTLGGWTINTDDLPLGKYVNYHAGFSPSAPIDDNIIINHDESDPVFVIKQDLGESKFTAVTQSTLKYLQGHL